MTLEEWEKHIADVHEDREGQSLCGERIKHLFHFVDIDHWFLNMQQGGRLIGCAACVALIVKQCEANHEISGR